ncbi:hypothetical protein ACWDA3_47080 [Nonomuraea rubra]
MRERVRVLDGTLSVGPAQTGGWRVRADPPRERAARAGAADVLLKDSDPEVLVAAVRELHQGRGLVDPQVTGRLINRFAALSPAAPPRNSTC